MSAENACTLSHCSLATTLEGSLDPSGTVVGYKGIPYGSIAKRWTRAFPHGPLGPRFVAKQFGPKCPQPSPPNNTLDFGPYVPFPDCGEDEFKCLNLNVYSPVNVDRRLPVLFWIHGGSLSFGAGSDPIWDPVELVRWAAEAGTPIVAVTINYRLGPFGFLAPKDPNDREAENGNFGLHDQRLALEWVHQHIAGFGGDPQEITVGGESAGGCSTHAQIALQGRPGIPRLFKRGIMQSGNIGVMGVWNRERMDQLWDDAVSQAHLSDTEKPLELMRELPADQLLLLPALDIDGFGVFADDYFLGPPLFGPNGEFLDAPAPVLAVMHGDNGDEGNIFRQASSLPAAMNDLKRTALQLLGPQPCAELLEVYGLGQSDLLSPDERSFRLHRFPEDARFYLPAAELYRVWPQAAFYHLSAKSPFASSRYANDSYHTLDLLYLFGNFDRWLKEEGQLEDIRLCQEIRVAWLKFIYGQDPWSGCYEGRAVTFGREGMVFGDYSTSRAWTQDRQDRIAALQRFGAAKVIDLATRVFP